MIEIKTAEPYRRCNCCHSSNNVSELSFRDGFHGTIVALCSSCMNELQERIKESEDLYGKRKRLIDANALLERMNVVTADDTCPLHIAAEIDQEIELAPTVDAVEVVHGRWIWNEENECWVCSNCEMSALKNYRGNSTDSNYCPNCGAKMDGERKDNG